MRQKQYKAINFDLEVDSLKKYYTEMTRKSYTCAYNDIGKYLENAGFSHRQGSGYVSNQPLTIYQVSKITKTLVKELPWISKCAKHFDVTNIGTQYDLMGVITRSEKTVTKFTQKEESKNKDNLNKKSLLGSLHSKQAILRNQESKDTTLNLNQKRNNEAR